jgi:3-oxoacyl-[acyl-carrier protein] reductase
MRNVLVTGGSRGLGLGIVRDLAASGHRVLAVARRPSGGLEEAAEAAARDGTGEIHFVALDLADIDAIPALVQEQRRLHGPLYGLVNNAGIGTEGMLATMHNSQIEALIRINTLSPIVLSKYAVRGMMAEGRGRIVNMASIIGATGYNGLSVYGATKASLVGFTKSLAREVGRVGVTVNAVAPGFVETELTGGLGDHQRTQIAKRSALRRLAEVEDVAKAVGFLMSDAARNITGTVLTVDAGNTA